MLWIVIGLLAPACWALGNHIDKYLLDRQLQQGSGALLLFSALVGLVALPVILVVHPDVWRIAPLHAAIVLLNGILYVISLLPYFYALERDEASVVVPLFQTSAVFSYLLGLLVLGEQLTPRQIGAALLIIVGSVIVTLEIGPRQATFKAEVFGLMLLASLLNALNWLLFKFVAVREDFWVTSFWEYAGFVVVGAALFIFVRPYRAQFLAVLRQNRLGVLGLVALNETASLTAKVATNVASLLAPLALVSTLHGLQPLFVFLYGVLLTLYLPRYGREKLAARVVLQKTGALALMIIGTSLLAIG